MPAFFDGGAADDRIAFRRRADGGYTLAPADSHRVYIGPDAFRHLGPFWTILRSEWRKSRFRPAAPRGFPDAWSTPRRWSPEDVSPFEARRVLDPAPDLRALAQLRADFARAFPALGKPEIAAHWGGMIDTMPDVVPILDQVPALPGLVLGTGLSGHGFGIGPAVGRVLASLATGQDPGHDLSRFRFGRFADDDPVLPGPSL